MAEPDALPDLQQPRRLGRHECVRLETERPARAQDQRGVCQRLGGRQQHQALRRLGQLVDATDVGILDLRVKLAGARQLEAAGQLRGGHASRQLHQREWVASGLGDEPIADVAVESARDDGAQQRVSVLLRQSLEAQLRQTVEVVRRDRIAHRDHDGQRLRPSAARNEPEDLAGGSIQPLGVLEQAQQRPLLRNRSK